MGKSLLDEHHPLFGGCYAGANSLEKVQQEVEGADFVLYVGALKSDFKYVISGYHGLCSFQLRLILRQNRPQGTLSSDIS